MQRRSGFSMIEVIVVLAILMLLAALAYPTYLGYLVKTRRIEAQVAMIEALQQEELYYLQHNAYLAFSSAQAPALPRLKWWSAGSAAASAYELDAEACPGRALTQCVQVRARPGTAKVDASFRDPDCGVLTISSTGEHGASGPSGRCWP